MLQLNFISTIIFLELINEHRSFYTLCQPFSFLIHLGHSYKSFSILLVQIFKIYKGIGVLINFFNLNKYYTFFY